MAFETGFVFSIIVVAAILMASNRVRYDVVALLVVLALMLSGVLTPGEALGGFGSSVVILVAGLLVIGEMLVRTGVASAVGDWILKKGGSNETRLLILIMLGAGVLGSIMSSTAVVAIFIPIVLRISTETNLNSSRMLMPMSYAALISGMLTLIATTPNIVVHEELKGAGFEGFGFFSFFLIGLAILVVAVVYMLLIGRRILPGDRENVGKSKAGRSMFELWEDYRLEENIEHLLIEKNSPLVGQSIDSSTVEDTYTQHILGIVQASTQGEERIAAPSPNTVLQTNDILVVLGNENDCKRLVSEQSLVVQTKTDHNRKRWFWEMGCAAVLIHPESRLIGKSLSEAAFRSQFTLQVVGIRRNRKRLADYKDVKLRSSDSLLVTGRWENIESLQSRTHDFVVLELPTEQKEIVPSYKRLPIALVILTSMVLLTVFDVVPLVSAVLMAALAAVFTRCLTMEDAYRSIHWSSLVLIAGMLPLADALDKTGGTQMIVHHLMTTVGDAGPYIMLSVIFFLTAMLGLVLSNTASAVLVAPIAIYAADALGVSPYPFAVAVLIAASAAYSTPVSTPVVTLVVDPGRYKFIDFIKVGVPLLLLTYLVTLLIAPIVFPFNPD
jgi:di/tricarboxylate transporter